MARKKLGEILVESGLLDDLQLRSALGHQRDHGGRLGEVLVKEGFASEDEIAECLAAQLDLPRMDLFESGVEPAAARLLPVEMAERHEVLPVRLEGEEGERGAFVWVAMSDPTNLIALDEVQFRTGKRVRPVVVTATQARAAIEHAYHGEPLSAPVPAAPVGVHAGGGAASVALEEAVDEDDDLPAIDIDPLSEEEEGALDADQQAAILAGLDSILGKGSSAEQEGFADPVELVSAVVRLLIRKGVLDESELVEELQRK